MRKICHVKCKLCNFDYQIQQDILYDESNYFHKLIDQNQEQTDFFLPEHLQYEEQILNLFFSEFGKKSDDDDETSQINTSLSKPVLRQLLELSKIFQTSNIKKRIIKIIYQKGSIDLFIQKCQKKKGKKSTKEEEKRIRDKITEKNYERFFQSQMSKERKIRILSKIKSNHPIYSSLQNYIFSINSNNEDNNDNNNNNNNDNNNKENNNKENNNKENEEDKEIFLILYDEKEIRKGCKRLKLKSEELINPRKKDMKIKELKEKIEEMKRNQEEQNEIEKEKIKTISNQAEMFKHENQALKKEIEILKQKLEQQNQENQQLEAPDKVLPQKSEQGDSELFIKILLLGSFSGKTTILTKYSKIDYYDFMGGGKGFVDQHIEIEGQRIKLQICDSASAELFLEIIPAYCDGVHGFLFVYDITNRNSFEELNKWITMARENVKNFIGIVVGNKMDLESEREISFDEGRAFAESEGFWFIETSAQDYTNIEEAFTLLITEILHKGIANQDNDNDKEKNSSENPLRKSFFDKFFKN